MIARGAYLAGLLSTAILAAGCGGSKTGDVTGSVTLNGTPLKGGQVTAYNDKGEAVGQSMIAEGRYELTNLTPGTVTLVVQTHTPDGQPVTHVKPPPRENEKAPPRVKSEKKGGEPEVEGPPSTLDPVPLKYTTTKESGLQVTVTGKNATYDIAMTGKGEIPKGGPIIPTPGGKQGPPPIPPGGFPPGFPPPKG